MCDSQTFRKDSIRVTSKNHPHHLHPLGDLKYYNELQLQIWQEAGWWKIWAIHRSGPALCTGVEGTVESTGSRCWGFGFRVRDKEFGQGFWAWRLKDVGTAGFIPAGRMKMFKRSSKNREFQESCESCIPNNDTPALLTKKRSQ